MAYSEILDAEIAEGSPLDNTTLTKIQDNFEYLKANSGAGGGSPTWSVNLSNGAIETDDQGTNVFKFAKNIEQAIKTIVNVPAGFAGGIVPKIELSVYSPLADNSKDSYLSVTVGLLKGANSIGNPTATVTKNITFSNSSVANDIQVAELDLANSGGMIGSEAIAGGDQLSILFSRKGQDAIDNILDDLYMIPSLVNIKFS